MSSQHKHPPISFRPPEADRARLLQYAADTGEKVNAVLAKALHEYLDRLSGAGDDLDHSMRSLGYGRLAARHLLVLPRRL